MAEIIDKEPSHSGPRSGPAAWLQTIITWWALLGGMVFILLTLMSIASIVGRKLLSAPVTGDMELLMMGSAIGTAAFLPLCEMADYHIRIDAFTARMSLAAQAAMDLVAHALLMAVSFVLTWRTALYAIDTHTYTEVSTLLQIPLWIPISLTVPSFALLTLAAVYRCCVSGRIALGAKA